MALPRLPPPPPPIHPSFNGPPPAQNATVATIFNAFTVANNKTYATPADQAEASRSFKENLGKVDQYVFIS